MNHQLSERSATLLILIIIHFLLFWLTAAWLLAAALSPMAHDASNVDRSLDWYFFGGLMLYPVALISCVVYAWVHFFKRRHMASIKVAVIPFGLVVLWIAIGASLGVAKAYLG